MQIKQQGNSTTWCMCYVFTAAMPSSLSAPSSKGVSWQQLCGWATAKYGSLALYSHLEQ